jgi:hypothetical protein
MKNKNPEQPTIHQNVSMRRIYQIRKTMQKENQKQHYVSYSLGTTKTKNDSRRK